MGVSTVFLDCETRYMGRVRLTTHSPFCTRRSKTVVHWQKSVPVSELLQHMSCLNDRYALDGLSPPSYAGLLWCLGWCDKPGSGGSISAKPAWKYRVGAEGFVQAKKALLAVSTTSIVEQLQQQRPVSSQPGNVTSTTTKQKPLEDSRTRKKRKTIDSYFATIKNPSKVK